MSKFVGTEKATLTAFASLRYVIPLQIYHPVLTNKTDEAAKTAVREGRNAVVDVTGRRIRCEPAKVNRTLVVSKCDGSNFTEAEAQKMLYGFGGTEALEFSAGMNSLPVRGLKEGKRCFVRFIYRQDAVDCYQVRIDFNNRRG
jgi:hypothetical protein